jgi:hypothetical protein
VFIDPSTSAETPVKFRFEYNSDENAFGFRNEQNMFVSFKSGGDTSDATAYPQHILSSYTAYARGEKITGEIVTRSASDVNIVGSQTYYSGYYPSDWTVSGLDTSDADATSDNIEVGYTAYVNGSKITGTREIFHVIVKKSTEVESYKPSDDAASTTIGNYALFGGGYNRKTNTSMSNTVYAYDDQLVLRTNLTLAVGANNLVGANNESYAFLGLGGYNNYGNDPTNTITCFNSSLTKTTKSMNMQAYIRVCGTSNITHAIFAGGQYKSGSNTQYSMNAYAVNTSLVQQQIANITQAGRINMPSATLANRYAVFAGGKTYTGTDEDVDIYDQSLTKSSTRCLQDLQEGACTSIGNYIVYFGGGNAGVGGSNKVQVIDDNFTFRYLADASQYALRGDGATISDHALFGGGYSGATPTNTILVEVYDSSLTKKAPNVFDTKASERLYAESCGEYAIFCSGPFQTAQTYYVN